VRPKAAEPSGYKHNNSATRHATASSNVHFALILLALNNSHKMNLVHCSLSSILSV
jgi:hypothetical protein